MPATLELNAFDRGVGPLADPLVPEAAQGVFGFHPTPELQARIVRLAEKSTSGSLSSIECEAYEGCSRASEFVTMPQRLASSSIRS